MPKQPTKLDDIYPAYILRDVREFYQDNPPGGEIDTHIESLSPQEIFEAYCTWHGLIGWSGLLWDTVQALANA